MSLRQGRESAQDSPQVNSLRGEIMLARTRLRRSCGCTSWAGERSGSQPRIGWLGWVPATAKPA
jgi:hypothetical protein